MCKCEKCGQGLVCPKCTPVIQHTNSIIIRCKDTAYNGGYPNALIIAPLYNPGENQYISVATIIGDNFWKKQHTYHGYTTVEKLASAIATWRIDTWFERFDIPKSNQMRKAVKDLMEQLKKHAAEMEQNENKELFVVFNQEGDLYQHETLEEAEKDFEAEKYRYDEYIGDEQVYLAKVIKKAYVVEDTERMKDEDPKLHGYESWVKWEEKAL
jgi:hypothetical protein